MSPGSCGCCKNCCNPRPSTGATTLRCGGWGGRRGLGTNLPRRGGPAAPEHARLNELADRCTFQAGNAFDVLRALAKEAPRFDVVILDPPAFAPRKSAGAQAAAGYKEINLRALKVLRPAGILV